MPGRTGSKTEDQLSKARVQTLTLLLACWVTLANHFPSLRLSFLIWKMGVLIPSPEFHSEGQLSHCLDPIGGARRKPQEAQVAAIDDNIVVALCSHTTECNWRAVWCAPSEMSPGPGVGGMMWGWEGSQSDILL